MPTWMLIAAVVVLAYAGLSALVWWDERTVVARTRRRLSAGTPSEATITLWLRRARRRQKGQEVITLIENSTLPNAIAAVKALSEERKRQDQFDDQYTEILNIGKGMPVPNLCCRCGRELMPGEVARRTVKETLEGLTRLTTSVALPFCRKDCSLDEYTGLKRPDPELRGDGLFKVHVRFANAVRSLRLGRSPDNELASLIARPEVQEVLSAIGSSETDVRELVHLLSQTEVGRERTLSTIADPFRLMELLAMRREGKSTDALAYWITYS